MFFNYLLPCRCCLLVRATFAKFPIVQQQTQRHSAFLICTLLQRQPCVWLTLSGGETSKAFCVALRLLCSRSLLCAVDRWDLRHRRSKDEISEAAGAGDRLGAPSPSVTKVHGPVLDCGQGNCDQTEMVEIELWTWREDWSRRDVGQLMN